MKQVRYSILLLCIFISTNALAGTATGLVEKLLVVDDGRIIFKLSGPHTGAPACATETSSPYGNWATRDDDMYKMLMNAIVNGLTVTVHGHNNCGDHGIIDRERPYYMFISNP